MLIALRSRRNNEDSFIENSSFLFEFVKRCLFFAGTQTIFTYESTYAVWKSSRSLLRGATKAAHCFCASIVFHVTSPLSAGEYKDHVRPCYFSCCVRCTATYFRELLVLFRCWTIIFSRVGTSMASPKRAWHCIAASPNTGFISPMLGGSHMPIHVENRPFFCSEDDVFQIKWCGCPRKAMCPVGSRQK